MRVCAYIYEIKQIQNDVMTKMNVCWEHNCILGFMKGGEGDDKQVAAPCFRKKLRVGENVQCEWSAGERSKEGVEGKKTTK